MKKDNNKLTPEEKRKAEDKMIETFRENSKDFDCGEGVEIIMSSGEEATGDHKVSHFFTSRIPEIEIKSKSACKTIEVEMSSVEEDNETLLHFLFKKTR